jgi:hypothetical protein
VGVELSKITDPRLRAEVARLDRIQNAKQLAKGSAAVGAVEAGIAQHAPRTPLARGPLQQRKRKGRVEIVVSLIAHVHRELDSDNLQGSLKWTRDSIADTLGLDDGDCRIRWLYAQVVTVGTEGVLVKIEQI